MPDKNKKNAAALLLSIGVCFLAGYPVAGRAQDQSGASSDKVAGSGDSKIGLTPTASKLEDDKLPYEVKILKKIEKEVKREKGDDIYESSSIPSLIFTPSQYALLREARIGFHTRSPSLQDLERSADPNDPNYRAPAALRDVKLGGIAFNTPDDWTIWLNGNRVTPDRLPTEIVDIHVYKDFIEVKWFDSVTNQVFPIRLRTNQKFNLDTRIFLPG